MYFILKNCIERPKFSRLVDLQDAYGSGWKLFNISQWLILSCGELFIILLSWYQTCSQKDQDTQLIDSRPSECEVRPLAKIRSSL